MSSSDDRRRPRVAGYRRRARPADGAQHSTTPAEAGEQPVVDAEQPEVEEQRPVVEAEHPEVEGAQPEVVAEAPARGGVPRALRVPLAALALALVLLAVVASVSLGDPGARDRDARAATAAARADLEQLLSYDHTTLEQQAAANAALLTGAFKSEYAATMERTILPLATEEKAIVRARSYEAGVMDQTDDTVRVQVFVNQAKTSAKQEQPSVDQNRVIATMQRVGDRWLIARLEAF